MRHLVACVLTMLTLTAFAQLQPSIPHVANRYRADLVRTSRLVWGIDAPVSSFAAQIHQESGWNSNAVSRVGAQGMAQFMPETSRWISGVNPALRENQPFNQAWAMRALVTYDLWLIQRVEAADACSEMSMALAAYNGGLGWVYRDIALAKAAGVDHRRWFEQVEQFNAGRSEQNFAENRAYPRRILLRYEPLYEAAGWGQGKCP